MEAHEFEETITLLEKIRGRHTELITVYVPAGFSLNSVAKQLEAEKSTASNIKSKNTRKAVLDSLERITRELKLHKETAENGMAIFCGNVSETEGQEDIQLWVIEPPYPSRIRMYRCDQTFVVEPLKEMLKAKDVYGLLVMDRKEATIGLLDGKQISVLRKMTSGVPGKIRAGGQCLAPDTLVDVEDKGKIRIEEVEEGDNILGINFNNMSKILNKCLKKWNVNKKEWLSIYTSNNKEIFASLDHIFFAYKDKEIIEVSAEKLSNGSALIGEEGEIVRIVSINNNQIERELIDLEVENNNFIANGIIVHNSSQRFERITENLAKEFFRRVSAAMKECFFDNKKLKGILIGGPVPTKEEFLKEGELVTTLKDKVLAVKDLGNTDESGLEDLVNLSRDILAQQEIIHEKKALEEFFFTLGKEPDKAAYKEEDVRKALEYGAVRKIILSKKLEKGKLKEYLKKAEEISAEFEIVSTETPEGQQFWNLGGIGALLRYGIGK